MTEQHFRLESLAYQNDAVEAVVGVFRGTPKAQAQDGPGNRCSLSWPQLQDNMQQIAQRQRISPERLQLSAPAQGRPLDICVEMETGTGKTLVYLRTLYRLHTAYGWNKFIIVVPSVAIRAGVMGTLAEFGLQLAQQCGLNHPIPAFEYDSSCFAALKTFDDVHPLGKLRYFATRAKSQAGDFVYHLTSGKAYKQGRAKKLDVLLKCGSQLGVQPTSYDSSRHQPAPLRRLLARYASPSHRLLRYQLEHHHSGVPVLAKRLLFHRPGSCAARESKKEYAARVEKGCDCFLITLNFEEFYMWLPPIRAGPLPACQKN